MFDITFYVKKKKLIIKILNYEHFSKKKEFYEYLYKKNRCKKD